MKHSAMPAVRTHPITGALIEPLWVRPDGRVCWPIMGAAEDGDKGDDGDKGGGSEKGDEKPGDAFEKGFPENTPTSEMTVEQREAYYKDKARKHEDRNKEWSRTFEGKTPTQVREELEEIRRAQMSDAEKTLDKVRTTERQKAAQEFGTKLVAAEFRAALAHVDGERRAQIIEGLHLSNYLTNSGDVDADKVKSYASAIAPADKGEGTRSHDYGGGRRTSGTEQRAGSVTAVMEARRAAREKQR